MRFELKDFGTDHWSTFAYADTCAVDYNGNIDISKLRVNELKRPIKSNGCGWKPEWGTRNNKGVITDHDHDDIDCLDDLEAIGLLKTGTLVNQYVALTELGLKVIAELRLHKSKGGQYRNFVSSILVKSEVT
jgi:hypothetical protein